MPRSEEKICRDIREIDRDYVEGYLPEAQIYYEFGIYDQITSLLQTPVGGTHLNLCSGPFFIEEAVKRQHPQVAVAGVDLNPEMIKAAQLTLSGLRAQYRTHANGVLKFSQFLVNDEGEPLHYWEYPLDFSDIPDFLDSNGPIEIIQGDVTKEAVIQAILQGKMLDSASFSFLGSSGSNLLEASARTRELRDVEFYNRCLEAKWKEILDEVYRQLSKYVKIDGEIVIGERCDDPDKIIEQMGRNKKYWTPVEIIQTVAPHQGEFSIMPILIQRFIRNSIPFQN